MIFYPSYTIHITLLVIRVGPRLEGMQCTKPRVFGSSILPPWVERGGCVDSIGKLSIIFLFELKRMLSLINIRDVLTPHTKHK